MAAVAVGEEWEAVRIIDSMQQAFRPARPLARRCARLAQDGRFGPSNPAAISAYVRPRAAGATCGGGGDWALELRLIAISRGQEEAPAAARALPARLPSALPVAASAAQRRGAIGPSTLAALRGSPSARRGAAPRGGFLPRVLIGHPRPAPPQVLQRAVVLYRTECERARSRAKPVDPGLEGRLLGLAHSIGTALCSLRSRDSGGGGGEGSHATAGAAGASTSSDAAGSSGPDGLKVAVTAPAGGVGGANGLGAGVSGRGGVLLISRTDSGTAHPDHPDIVLDRQTGKWRSRF